MPGKEGAKYVGDQYTHRKANRGEGEEGATKGWMDKDAARPVG